MQNIRKKEIIAIFAVMLMVVSTVIVATPDVVKAGSNGGENSQPDVTCWKCSGSSPVSQTFPYGTTCGQGDASNYPYSSQPTSCGGGGGGNDPPTARLDGPEEWQLPKGESYTFKADRSSDPDGDSLTYEWQFCGNCEWISTGSYPQKTKSFGATGTYEISLKVTDSNGASDTDSHILTVNENKRPVADAGGGAYNRYYVNKGYSLTVDGTGSYDPDPVVDQYGVWHSIERYDWKWFGDETTWHNDIGATASHTYNQVGEYIITLRVHDFYGGTDTDTATVYVTEGNPDENQPPVPILKGPDVAFAGREITFDGSDSYDPDGGIITHWWIIHDIDGEHTWTSNCPPTTKSYTFKSGSPSAGWLVVLGVMDNDCEVEWDSMHVYIPNSCSLTIDKSGPNYVYEGQEINYKIKVCNPCERIDPKIVDDYDQDKITIIDADGGIDNGNKIVWEVPVIEAGECIEFNIKAIPNENLEDCTEIINWAQVYNEDGILNDQDSVTSIYVEDLKIEVDKKVRLNNTDDPSLESYEWFDEIEAEVGDNIRFKLSLTNTGDSNQTLQVMFDLLPYGLKYNGNATCDGESIVPFSIQEIDDLEWHGTKIIFLRRIFSITSLRNPQNFDVEGSITNLEPGETRVIEFDALVMDCGRYSNEVVARIDTADHECMNTLYADIKDQATVEVPCNPPEPGVSVVKLVKNECGTSFSENIDAEIGEIVYFKIVVSNIGELPLDITVVDKLPVELTYNNHASPKEYDDVVYPTDGTIHYIWEFDDVQPGDDITITFQAIVEQCGYITNTVEVAGDYGGEEDVEAEDEAYIQVECPGDPCLQYSPEGHDYGCHIECEIDTTTFEIWNGCESVLEYNLSWGCGWIQSLTPTSGTSAGEHNTITVQINTAGMYPGEYSCDIHITSNGGSGIFRINLTVADQCPCPGDDDDDTTGDDDDDDFYTNEPPLADILTPLKQKFYFRDKEFFSLGRTLIIGPITIKVDASDSDGFIQKVEFYIDDDIKETIDEGPYEYKWDEKIFGEYDIKVKVYDNEGSVREEVRNVLILNFGSSS